MRRVMYLFLPNWPIDRLRRLGAVPSLCAGVPAEDRDLILSGNAARIWHL